MRSRWRTWKGHSFLHLDYSGFGHDFDALAAEVAAIDAVIVRQKPGSVLVLIDLRDTVASGAVVRLFKASSPRTEHFIARHALIGVTGIKRFLAEQVARISGRTMRLFDDEAAACDWLIRGADAGVEIGGRVPTVV